MMPAAVKDTLKKGATGLEGPWAAAPASPSPQGKSRVTSPPPRQFALIDKAKLLARSPAFWSWADYFVRNTDIPGMRGRRPRAPDYVKALLIALWATNRSMFALVTELSPPEIWGSIADVLNEHRPPHYLPAPYACPSLNQLKSFNARLRSMDQDVIHRMQQAVHDDALRLAQDHGFLSPQGRFDSKRPNRAQFVAMDGTVLRQAFGRGDDDSVGPQIVFNDEGAKNKPWGCKVVTTSVRGDMPGSRLILRFDSVPPGPAGAPGGESGVIAEAVRAVATGAEGGLKGLIVDSALRGNLVSELAREGIVTVNYPHAAANPNRASGGRMAKGRQEKTREVGRATHSVKGQRKACEHPVVMVGGVPHTRALDDKGEERMIPLAINRYMIRRNADGSFRQYHVYEMPCAYGDFECTLNLFPKETGTENLGEFTRYFPPGSPQFNYLYGRRNDTESWHRQWKRDSSRMPVRGLALQSVYLSGLLILQNAEAVERLRGAEVGSGGGGSPGSGGAPPANQAA